MKKNVRFTENGIYLESSQTEKEGKEIPLYSGSIHYGEWLLKHGKKL